jgi:hypothetical protein
MFVVRNVKAAWFRTPVNVFRPVCEPVFRYPHAKKVVILGVRHVWLALGVISSGAWRLTGRAEIAGCEKLHVTPAANWQAVALETFFGGFPFSGAQSSFVSLRWGRI